MKKKRICPARPAAILMALVLLFSFWWLEVSAQVSVEASSGLTTEVTGSFQQIRWTDASDALCAAISVDMPLLARKIKW